MSKRMFWLGIMALTLTGCGRDLRSAENRVSRERGIATPRPMGLKPLTLSARLHCMTIYYPVLKNLVAIEQKTATSSSIDRCSADIDKQFNTIESLSEDVQIGGSRFFEYFGAFFSKEPGMACDLADPRFSTKAICMQIAFAWPMGRVVETQMSVIPNQLSVEYRCTKLLNSKLPSKTVQSDFVGQADVVCKEGNISPSGKVRPMELP